MFEVIYNGCYGNGVLHSDMWIVCFADGTKVCAELCDVEIVWESVL